MEGTSGFGEPVEGVGVAFEGVAIEEVGSGVGGETAADEGVSIEWSREEAESTGEGAMTEEVESVEEGSSFEEEEERRSLLSKLVPCRICVSWGGVLNQQTSSRESEIEAYTCFGLRPERQGLHLAG